MINETLFPAQVKVTTPLPTRDSFPLQDTLLLPSHFFFSINSMSTYQSNAIVDSHGIPASAAHNPIASSHDTTLPPIDNSINLDVDSSPSSIPNNDFSPSGANRQPLSPKTSPLPQPLLKHLLLFLSMPQTILPNHLVTPLLRLHPTFLVRS